MIVRIEGGGANENAVRTLLIGLVCALAILVGLDPARKLYDETMRPAPWITATAELVPAPGGGILVEYSVTTHTYVTGYWTAWLEGEDGTRLCHGSGPGRYDHRAGTKRLWTLAIWIGPLCAPPRVPFRAGVKYNVSLPSGATREDGPYYSEFYTP